MDLIQLTEQQIEEFKEAFNLFDKDNSGTISKDELGNVLKSLGHNPSDLEVTDLIQKVDVDGSGTIEFPEFLTLMRNRNQELQSPNEIEDAFKIFDKDGDGQITSQDILNTLANLGEKLTIEDIIELVNDAGAEDNGINYEQFARIFKDLR